jgi:hypothetical protein
MGGVQSAVLRKLVEYAIKVLDVIDFLQEPLNSVMDLVLFQNFHDFMVLVV